jgi:hypothetical protein
MKDQQSHLVGMFLVLTSTDHEHYRIGHIAAAVCDCYLIQFDKLKDSEDHPLPPMELYTVEELSEVCENCGQKLANLFKSRADMERARPNIHARGDALRVVSHARARCRGSAVGEASPMRGQSVGQETVEQAGASRTL